MLKIQKEAAETIYLWKRDTDAALRKWDDMFRKIKQDANIISEYQAYKDGVKNWSVNNYEYMTISRPIQSEFWRTEIRIYHDCLSFFEGQLKDIEAKFDLHKKLKEDLIRATGERLKESDLYTLFLPQKRSSKRLIKKHDVIELVCKCYKECKRGEAVEKSTYEKMPKSYKYKVSYSILKAEKRKSDGAIILTLSREKD